MTKHLADNDEALPPGGGHARKRMPQVMQPYVFSDIPALAKKGLEEQEMLRGEPVNRFGLP